MSTNKPETEALSKSDLLKQLKIEQPESVATGFGAKHLLLAGLVGALLAGGAVLFLTPDSPNDAQQWVSQTVSSPSARTTNDLSQNQRESIEGQAGNPLVSSVDSTSSSRELARQSISSGKEVLNASGYVTARLIATVSAETIGLIKTVEVEEGMEVSKGQILATLDDAVAQVNLNLAQAQLNAQKARLVSRQTDLDEALRVYQRVTSMAENGFASEAEITQAKTRVDVLKSGLVTAQADIDVARMQYAAQKERLDDHTIRAPFSGVVTVKNAQPGEIVSPSSAGGFTRTGICTIVDMESLEIEVDVNEAFIRKVSPGQPVIAHLDAYPNWDIPAKVIAIIPTADRAKATVRVRIKIEEKDERILPDMGVKVTLFENS